MTTLHINPTKTQLYTIFIHVNDIINSILPTITKNNINSEAKELLPALLPCKRPLAACDCGRASPPSTSLKPSTPLLFTTVANNSNINNTPIEEDGIACPFRACAPQTTTPLLPIHTHSLKKVVSNIRRVGFPHPNNLLIT